jgi:hypothetical protein
MKLKRPSSLRLAEKSGRLRALCGATESSRAVPVAARGAARIGITSATRSDVPHHFRAAARSGLGTANAAGMTRGCDYPCPAYESCGFRSSRAIMASWGSKTGEQNAEDHSRDAGCHWLRARRRIRRFFGTGQWRGYCTIRESSRSSHASP